MPGRNRSSNSRGIRTSPSTRQVAAALSGLIVLPLSVVLLAAASLVSVGAKPRIISMYQAAPSPRDVEFFESKIRPLLAESCFSCHGPDKQAGGLRLDSKPALMAGATSGLVIVPSRPEESRLIRAVEQSGPIKMPPSGKLKPGQIADLAEWIRRGAPWPEAKPAAIPAQPAASSPPFRISPEQRRFWSFQPVTRPAVPSMAFIQRSEIRNAATNVTPPSRFIIENPIDSFIAASLSRKGLAQAPRADRRTLIRRATFDLTGLPPTPREVQDFVADKEPGAWVRVIDRLLASPRYGERWGRHWLDLVRYCDSLDSRSLGSEGDISEAWKYRDWVIDALNADMPYTEFITEQIAGDLAPPMEKGVPSSGAGRYILPNASGIIATTMLSIGNWGNGDADKDKILTDIADDQLDVVSRTFMGLTLACARCHNHKFDPLSTRDYYGIAGIFFSTHILAKLTPKGAGENIMKVALFKPELVEARKRYATDLAALEQKRAAILDEARGKIAASLLPETTKYMTAAWEYRRQASSAASISMDTFATSHGLRPYALRQWLDYQGPSDYPLMRTPIRDVLGNKGVYGLRGDQDTPSAIANTNREPRSILTFTLPPRSVSIHPGPTTGVAVLWSSPISGTVKVEGKVSDADPAGGDGIAWDLAIRSESGLRTLASGGFENSGAQAFDAAGSDKLNSVKVGPGDRIELHVLPKMSHTCDTTTVDFRISEAGGRTWDMTRDVLDNLHEGGNPHPDSFGNPAVWRFVDMAGKPGAAIDSAASAALAAWRGFVGHPRDEERSSATAAAEQFSKAFKIADSSSPFWPTGADANAMLPESAKSEAEHAAADLEALRHNAPPPLEYANGAMEGGVPESPHAGVHDVHVHLRGRYDRLAEIVPRKFPTILAGENQPLIGPGSGRLELARWLASERHPLTARVLVNRVWQHHFGEAIVRTPSNFGFLGERPTNPELLDWLAGEFMAKGWSLKSLHRLIMTSAAYQATSRTDARAARIDPDNRLFGRMNRTRMEAEEVRDSLLSAAGKLDATMGGPAVRDFKIPRRSVYVITVRSDRTGFGPLFDVADSTNLVDKRTVSTVAPQALFLLNDPFAIDQARGLAKRLLEEKLPDDLARIERAYELLYGRPANQREVSIGLEFLAKERMPGGGARTVSIDSPESDRAAWSAYSQILLSANEFIYVD